MPEHSPQHWLNAARCAVEGVCAILVRPREWDMDRCAMLFGEAQGHLERLCTALAQGAPCGRELRAQAVALRREIQQAGVLLEQAVRFSQNWLARLSGTAGYTAAGVPAPIRSRISISVLG
jgi:hypothetical protein